MIEYWQGLATGLVFGWLITLGGYILFKVYAEFKISFRKNKVKGA